MMGQTKTHAEAVRIAQLDLSGADRFSSASALSLLRQQLARSFPTSHVLYLLQQDFQANSLKSSGKNNPNLTNLVSMNHEENGCIRRYQQKNSNVFVLLKFVAVLHKMVRLL
ncbi:hypothetical protein [Paenibacillus tyrfis]|uniref:hypothetical protein n=1 Tax=Paenibacillus tyrfis TaxID=1501230 RepID=UPI000B58F5FF|nr:hypothetical protein [Paenibacillus tyrfis]